MEKENPDSLHGKKINTDGGHSEKKMDLKMDRVGSGNQKVVKKKKKSRGVVFQKVQEIILF